MFFVTAQGLVPQDTDGAEDIYDARLGGGLSGGSRRAESVCRAMRVRGRDESRAVAGAGQRLAGAGRKLSAACACRDGEEEAEV